MAKSLKEQIGSVLAKERRGTILEITQDIFWPESIALVLIRMLDDQIRNFMTTPEYVLEKNLEVGKEITWSQWPFPLSILNKLIDVSHDEELIDY